MVTIPVQCPHCQSSEVIKVGTQATGTRRLSVKTGSARGGSSCLSTTIAAASAESEGP